MPSGEVNYRTPTDAKLAISSSNPTLEFRDAAGATEARIGYNTVIADSLVINKVASNSYIEVATTHIDLNADDVLINGVKAKRDTASIQLYRESQAAIPVTPSGTISLTFSGHDNAVVNGATITPNISGSVYGVPVDGLYEVTLEFWADRFSGSGTSTFDVMMGRAGTDDISNRSQVVGVRCRFTENGVRTLFSIKRTIRLTTAQTMQFKMGYNADPVTIYGSADSPIIVNYTRIDD